jgi:cytochrome b
MTSLPLTRVWDLPLRLFHLFFALSLAGALLIGFFVDDDSALFAFHKLLGLTAAGLLVARLGMGWIGGRHARWSGLLFSPQRLLGHLKTYPRQQTPAHAGHNPAAAWVYVLMFVLVTGLVTTGLSMERAHVFEEVHEVLAVGLAVMILLHISGLAAHTLKFREAIALSMVHGRKQADPSEATGPAKAAGVLLAVTLLLLLRMWFSYDPVTQTVHLPGTGITLQLGEEHDEGYERTGHEHDDHEEEEEKD